MPHATPRKHGCSDTRDPARITGPSHLPQALQAGPFKNSLGIGEVSMATPGEPRLGGDVVVLARVGARTHASRSDGG